ncbi:MAG: GNAT family N-acetyltransferase [Oscillospiraceae bacterium]|nr:GNAT family N-acetyltransferase [Oscillospiraceae bacterium]
MNKIYERLLYETNIDIENIKNKFYIVKSLAENMLTITQFEKGFLLFEANENYIPMIYEYIKKYKDNLFTPTAIEFFNSKFRVCDENNPFKYIYGIDDIKNLNTDCILSSTFRIDISSVKPSMTDKFDNYYSKNINNDLLYFGTIISGEIVSLTNTHPNELNFKAVSLSYETLPEHRNKGYAKSNTAAIIKHLLANDFAVVYDAGINNIASIKTCETLGLQRYGCQLAFFAL